MTTVLLLLGGFLVGSLVARYFLNVWPFSRHKLGTPAARRLLDKFFDDVNKLPGSEQVLIWEILTALRGPDHPAEHSLKITTTARIRGIVCPVLSRKMGAFTDTSGYPPKHPRGQTHFQSHIRRASGAMAILGYIE